MEWICYDENQTFTIKAKSLEHAKGQASVYDAKVLGSVACLHQNEINTLVALIGSFNKSHSTKTIISKINAETAALGIKTSAEVLPTEATSFRMIMLSFIDGTQASMVSAKLAGFHSSIVGYNTVVFRVYD